MSSIGGKLAALCAAVAVSSCTCNVVADPEGHVCDTGNVCPSGYLCLAGVCHSTSGTGGGSGGGSAGGGTAGGSGGSGGGNGSCTGVVCNSPPMATCSNASTLRTFTGTCNPLTGACVYSPMDTACAQGCNNGQCSGDTCGTGCTTAPGPSCQGNNLITSSLPGTCNNGQCRYTESNVSCPNGCANDACVPQGVVFTQVLPRVRHEVTAVDQSPASAGQEVVVVGPAGAISRWNGTAWAPVQSGFAANLSSIWFFGAGGAYIVAEGGLLRLSSTNVTRVNGFPVPVTGGGKLIDVHGTSESNVAVVDNSGTVYRLGLSGTTWQTSTRVNSAPYRMNGVYLDPSNQLRYFGSCNSTATAARGCVVYHDTVTGYVDDHDPSVASFRSAGLSLDPSGDETWLGLEVPGLRRHSSAGMFDPLNSPSGMDGGTVVGIVAANTALVPTRYVLTAPARSLGYLYRVTGPVAAPTVDPMMETLYGYQALSKNESAGVIVVDMDTTYKSSTITRRSSTVNEVLDLGESWVSGASFSGGSVLLNAFGDVALRQNMATFQLRRFPLNLTATDIAAGSAFALITGDDGSAWRLPYVGPYAQVTLSPAPGKLTGACRASDTEWYLVGASGAIHSYDGNAAHAMTSGSTAGLLDVDCPSPGAAVACGDSGAVLRLNNGSWSAVTGTNAPTTALTSCRLVGNTVYVAGPNVFARHQNGAWTAMASKPKLDGLVVKSVNEAYAASGSTVLRFDGTTWQILATAPQSLMTGFTIGARVVFAGNGGVVMEGQ